MDKDYLTTVFIDANFENNGIVELKLKPGFADSREFYIKQIQRIRKNIKGKRRICTRKLFFIKYSNSNELQV